MVDMVSRLASLMCMVADVSSVWAGEGSVGAERRALKILEGVVRLEMEEEREDDFVGDFMGEVEGARVVFLGEGATFSWSRVGGEDVWG